MIHQTLTFVHLQIYRRTGNIVVSSNIKKVRGGNTVEKFKVLQFLDVQILKELPIVLASFN